MSENTADDPDSYLGLISIWDMPEEHPGVDPEIKALEATVRHLLTHAGGIAEALRMNVMATLSKGVCAADTNHRFEAARKATGATRSVQFARAYEAARDSTTDEMIGRFYDGTAGTVSGALQRVEEPAVRRAIADVLERCVIEVGLPEPSSDLHWEMYDACKDAINKKGQWADRLDEEGVYALVKSINERGASIISMSARTARTGVALCAATVAMLESSERRSLKDALKDARQTVPGYAGALINNEAGFVVSSLLEEIHKQTRRRRGTDAWKKMVRVALKRTSVQASYVMASEIFKAVYGATVRGTYRAATQKTLFEASYPAVLQEVAAGEAAVPQPNHATMYRFADAGLIDYKASTGPSGESGLVDLYEATYREAYATALKRARQLLKDVHGEY